MKKPFFSLFALLVCFKLFAQETQMLITVKVPNTTDEVYIVGNQPALGNWNPGAVKMQRLSDYERSILVNANFPAEFKFTKGSWESEGYTGDKRNNPNLTINEPKQQASFEILGWYNDGKRTFTEHYIKANKGKYSFEIPEVQELAHIIFALTATGKSDQNLVNHEGAYYQEVMKAFKPFENDTLVKQLDERLKQGMYSILKMDACAFYFNGDQILQDSVYDKLSWSGFNQIEPFITELERFAKQSNFRVFYENHKPYYAQLIREMETVIPIRKQWDWLEKNFNNQYDHYRITFSPLVNSIHSTNNFVQPNFRQTVMFVRGPITDPHFNGIIRKGLMNMMVFTEIDHNYVNPLSDQFMDDIKTAMPDLSSWATPEALSNYGSEYAVFNEYMTWAVYSLYAKEQFKKKDFEVLTSSIEEFMVERRGFVKYKEFNRELLAKYKKKEKKDRLDSLYPAMINWCRNN